MYTAELSSYIASFFVPIFTIIFLYGYLEGLFGKATSSSEWVNELRQGKFNIGYVEDDPVEVKFAKMEAVIEEVKPAHSQQFVRDGVSVLVGLGLTKTEAKRDATKFLEKNPQVQTIDEFITGVMKK